MRKTLLVGAGASLLAVLLAGAVLLRSRALPEPGPDPATVSSAEGKTRVVAAPLPEESEEPVADSSPVDSPPPRGREKAASPRARAPQNPGARELGVDFRDPALRAKVAHFTAVGEENVEERLAELDALKQQAEWGDTTALHTLMAVANAAGCMSPEAVKRLRGVPSEALGEFLLRLARAEEVRASVAAIEALPDVLEDGRCVEEVGLLLDEAHGTPHMEERRDACLAALGELGSPDCIPLAARELGQLDVGSDLDYGSRWMVILQRVGDARAAVTIEQYAARLWKHRPKEKWRAHYVDGKIQEALAVAERLLTPEAGLPEPDKGHRSERTGQHRDPPPW